jgi:hypothetical protein
MGDEITVGYVVVRRHQSDTLRVIHYHVDIGGIREDS